LIPVRRPAFTICGDATTPENRLYGEPHIVSDQTANLALPYILPSQAQKHVFHNEALQRLDAVVQLAVTGELPAPPVTPIEGECYLIASGAMGAWSGKAGLARILC
jgi:hypothetical protein